MYPASLKWQEKRKPKRRPHISVSLAENNERAEDRKREKRRNKPQPKQTATPSEGTCTSPSGFHRRDRATSTPLRAPDMGVQGRVCGAKSQHRAWGSRQQGMGWETAGKSDVPTRREDARPCRRVRGRGSRGLCSTGLRLWGRPNSPVGKSGRPHCHLHVYIQILAESHASRNYH